MTPEHWRRVDDVLLAAFELEEPERRRFVAERCGADSELRREIDALLDAHSKAGSFLEQPVAVDRSGAGKIGPYRLEREVGRGGMSTVYLAIRDDGEFRQQVAVKLIRSFMGSEAVLRRFEIERQILAGLIHPNVARLYDGGRTAQGDPYFVLEYVEGKPIDAFCEARDLGIDERIDLFLAVCDAVQFAHRNLVVHCDLKPANILVDNDGVPKLLDFGIAKLLDPSYGDVTRQGRRPMTPRYASPEQRDGRQITTATDVYALGLLLHELLTGRLPADREPPEIGNRRLRGDLRIIVEMALREESDRRYASVEQLSTDLRRYLAGMPVLARRATLGYRGIKFLRRHWLGAGIAAAFVVMILGFAVVMARQVEQTAAALRRVELEHAKATQVSEFLLGLFESSDPKRARGDRVTARELLDRGLKDIEALKDQPLVQAAALDTIGRIYGELALYDEARPLLERALAQRREILGENHVDVADSLGSLGRLLAKAGEYDRAERLHREALALRRRLLGNEHLRVAESLFELANVMWHVGRYDEVERLQRRVLEIRKKQLGDKDPAVAFALNELANVHAARGELASAEALYRETLYVQRRRLGDDHLDVTSLRNNLATVLTRQEKHAEAETLYRKILATRRQVLGPEHPDVALVLHNLGSVLMRQKMFEEAELVLREALAIRRRVFGDRHMSVAANLSLLAALERARGDLDGAVKLYRQSLDLGRPLVPADHPAVAGPLLDLGRTLVAQGNYRAAEPVFREAWERRRAGLSETNTLTAEASLELGRCLLALGELPEAEERLLASYRVLSQRDVESASRAREALTLLYQAVGAPEKATLLSIR